MTKLILNIEFYDDAFPGGTLERNFVVTGPADEAAWETYSVEGLADIVEEIEEDHQVTLDSTGGDYNGDITNSLHTSEVTDPAAADAIVADIVGRVAKETGWTIVPA